MAKIVYKSLATSKSAKAAGARAVGKKRVAMPGGGWRTVRTLDVNSPNFDDAYLYVIRSNVAKARRENKRILGVADVVPRKR
ncbi:MAG TPA: hypothetical protein VFB68_18135 [Xanthobacteraceae bacterium]|nr:hypothetical protein [Xanthobacteraceae bacterium]